MLVTKYLYNITLSQRHFTIQIIDSWRASISQLMYASVCMICVICKYMHDPNGSYICSRVMLVAQSMRMRVLHQ